MVGGDRAEDVSVDRSVSVSSVSVDVDEEVTRNSVQNLYQIDSSVGYSVRVQSVVSLGLYKGEGQLFWVRLGSGSAIEVVSVVQVNCVVEMRVKVNECQNKVQH